MEDSGSVAGFLNIHVEIDDVEQDLDVSLRLCGAAHDTEAEEGFAVFGNEGGNDGVEGAFSGCVGVGSSGLEVEHFAAVLEAETEFGWADAGAEAAVVALNE